MGQTQAVRSRQIIDDPASTGHRTADLPCTRVGDRGRMLASVVTNRCGGACTTGAAAAALPSEPPSVGNCAHQLANYLANRPPCVACKRQDHPFALSPCKTGTALRLPSSARAYHCC